MKVVGVKLMLVHDHNDVFFGGIFAFLKFVTFGGLLSLALDGFL